MYCIYGACACVRVCVFFLLCARVSQSIYSTIVFAMETNVTIYIHSSLFELKITIFSFFFLSFLLFFSPYPFQYPTKYFLPRFFSFLFKYKSIEKIFLSDNRYIVARGRDD